MSRVIVVPGAGPDAAATAAAAARHAARRGLPLEAVASIRPPPDLERLAARAGLPAHEIVRRLVAETRAGLEASAPGAETTVRIGAHPFVEIVRRAIETEAALVVKAAEGAPSRLFASLDQHLLRKCPCPVWLRRGEGGEGPRRVLAALDVAPDAEEPGLERCILGAAADLAEDGGELLLVHVWEAAGAGLVRLWSEGGGGERAAAGYVEDVRAARAEALERAAEIARSVAGGRLGVRTDLRRGEPREVIPAVAGAFGAEVVALGTVGRAGAPGLIIGNTAEDVLNAIEGSVLAVKPPGWTSPVVVD